MDPDVVDPGREAASLEPAGVADPGLARIRRRREMRSALIDARQRRAEGDATAWRLIRRLRRRIDRLAGQTDDILQNIPPVL